MAIFEYKKVKFKIDILGTNAWRWTVLPRRQDELTLIGQVVGTEEIAIAHCQSEIDGLLERDELR